MISTVWLSIHSAIVLSLRLIFTVLGKRRVSMISMLADWSQSGRLELCICGCGIEGVGINFGYMGRAHGCIWPADAWLVAVTDRVAVGRVKQSIHLA